MGYINDPLPKLVEKCHVTHDILENDSLSLLFSAILSNDMLLQQKISRSMEK